MRKIAVVAASLASLLACEHEGTETQEPELILHSYDAPSAYAPELATTINILLSRGKGEPKQGNALLSPGGQVLVAAPASFHPGVQQLMQQLQRDPPAPPPSVRLTYWLVLGEPSASGGRQGVPQAIGPALDAIEKTSGSMKFVLLESLSLTSVSGEHAQVEGAHAQIRQKTTISSIAGSGTSRRLPTSCRRRS